MSLDVFRSDNFHVFAQGGPVRLAGPKKENKWRQPWAGVETCWGARFYMSVQHWASCEVFEQIWL